MSEVLKFIKKTNMPRTRISQYGVELGGELNGLSHAIDSFNEAERIAPTIGIARKKKKSKPQLTRNICYFRLENYRCVYMNSKDLLTVMPLFFVHQEIKPREIIMTDHQKITGRTQLGELIIEKTRLIIFNCDCNAETLSKFTQSEKINTYDEEIPNDYGFRINAEMGIKRPRKPVKEIINI